MIAQYFYRNLSVLYIEKDSFPGSSSNVGGLEVDKQIGSEVR